MEQPQSQWLNQCVGISDEKFFWGQVEGSS